MLMFPYYIAIPYIILFVLPIMIAYRTTCTIYPDIYVTIRFAVQYNKLTTYIPIGSFCFC